MSDDKYGIRFTIPDKPPKEQLEMVRDMREMVLTFAEIAGEADITDLAPFDEAIAKLEADIAVSDLPTTDHEPIDGQTKAHK